MSRQSGRYGERRRFQFNPRLARQIDSLEAFRLLVNCDGAPVQVIEPPDVHGFQRVTVTIVAHNSELSPERVGSGADAQSVPARPVVAGSSGGDFDREDTPDATH